MKWDGFSIVQAGLKWYSTLRIPKHRFKVSFPEMFEFAFWGQAILNSGGGPQNINNEVSEAVKDRYFVSKISFSVPFFPQVDQWNKQKAITTLKFQE